MVRSFPRPSSEYSEFLTHVAHSKMKSFPRLPYFTHKTISGKLWKLPVILSVLVFWRTCLHLYTLFSPAMFQALAVSYLLGKSSVLKLCLHSHKCTHTQLRKKLRSSFYISLLLYSYFLSDFYIPVLEWPHLFRNDIEYESMPLCLLSKTIRL